MTNLPASFRSILAVEGNDLLEGLPLDEIAETPHASKL